MAYTTVDNPELFFQTLTWSGNDSGTSRAFTFDGSENMQPDFVWMKIRTGWSADHNLFDSVRGTGKNLHSNSNEAEGTNDQYGYVSSFDTNGFTGSNGSSGANPRYYYNENGGTYVSWNWKAGTSFSNSSGSNSANLDSTGSVSTTAGFSIVSFTGNRSTTRNIYHGLGAVPKMIIFKNRDTTNGVTIYNEAIGNANKLTLNGTNASGSCSACFASTTPTSTLFTVGDDSDTNGTNNNMIAYCFTDVKGYSKFGNYTGNGNADGTFVYTGFKPAFMMVKRTDNTSSWAITDSTRDPINAVDNYLSANNTNAESDFDHADFLSNGIKFRTTNDGWNVSGGSYIYMCFAESPFTTSTGIPTTAR